MFMVLFDLLFYSCSFGWDEDVPIEESNLKWLLAIFFYFGIDSYICPISIFIWFDSIITALAYSYPIDSVYSSSSSISRDYLMNWDVRFIRFNYPKFYTFYDFYLISALCWAISIGFYYFGGDTIILCIISSFLYYL